MRLLKRKVRTHYVYGLIDPSNGQLFYVGQTRNPTRRLHSHNNNYAKHHNVAYRLRMQAIRKRRKLAQMIILATGTDQDIDALEIEYIKRKRAEGHPLVNILAGGRHNRSRLS